MIVEMEFEMQTVESACGEARVRLGGELDLASGPRLQGELDRLRAVGASARLDLSGLDFMDSAGLVAILTAVQAARRDGVHLEIERTLRPEVARLFALTRTDAFLWPAAGATT